MSTSLLARLPHAALKRVVRDTIAEELSSTRGRRFTAPTIEWSGPVELGPDGLDLDSLERFSLAARLNEFFALFETGLEDNLLRARTLDDLVQVIQTSLQEHSRSVSFRSGGTTGSPRTVRHETRFLEQEIGELAQLLRGRRRVVLTVPSHHIYGFLFGVLLPEYLGVPVVDARWSLLGGNSRPDPGDVVVAVPFVWEQVLSTLTRCADDVWAVSSTAPLPSSLARSLADTPLERVIEVYGSSETGGVRWRDHCGSARGARGADSADGADGAPPFELFACWRRIATASPERLERLPCADARVGHNAPALWELPDRIRWTGERHFYPDGRRDAVVQVGGHNIDLEEVRRRILTLDLTPKIQDCALRLDAPGERLRAFLVTSRSPTEGEEQQAHGRLRALLRDAEIPGDLTWGRELPRSDIGKSRAW